MAGSNTGQRGFTLIEILVVIVILGLLATVALISLGDAPQRRELEQRSRELFLVLQAASERAILDNSEIGVQIDDTEARFLRYIPLEHEWEEVTQGLFRTREWPDIISAELETATDFPRMPTDDESALLPDIVFFSSGESTPFRLALSLNTEDERRYRIETDGLNPLALREPAEESEVELQ